MPLVLAVDNLNVRFALARGEIEAVRDLSFSLWGGEILAVVGESGSGKTRAFLAIMGLLARNGMASGVARLGETDLMQLSPRALNRYRGRDLAMIFQDPGAALNPVMKVRTQMAEVLHVHHAVPMPQAELAALDMLETVGIPDPDKRGDCYPHELPGGMQQRVTIGMALMCRPKVLIADEPTTALDATVQAQVLELFKAVCNRLGTALVLITHDLGVAAAAADRIMVMYAGEAVEIAPADDLFSNPRHPYTRGLLAATPHAGTQRGKLQTIPGLAPVRHEPVAGCAYAPRCPHRTMPCTESPVALREAAPAHLVRCPYGPNSGVRKWT